MSKSKISYDEITPGELTTLRTDFINPQSQKIQEHIDWKLTVSKDGEILWGPTQLSHTSEGSLKNLKYEFEEEGTYNFEFGIEGILFQPIPLEKVSFDIVVGEANAQPDNQPPDTSNPPNDNGGGCLIATAAYGSEMAPQVQQLRELRDNKILQTESGKSFMISFNEFYYSFSPTIADYERENPLFKESMKVALTPMLTSLSVLNHVDIDSEPEMLGYGISLILLNIGMYAGIPVFGILKLYQFRKN
ncbi:MAG: copper-binding protein [Nitrosopumilaceae archaeon]